MRAHGRELVALHAVVPVRDHHQRQTPRARVRHRRARARREHEVRQPVAVERGLRGGAGGGDRRGDVPALGGGDLQRERARPQRAAPGAHLHRVRGRVPRRAREERPEVREQARAIDGTGGEGPALGERRRGGGGRGLEREDIVLARRAQRVVEVQKHSLEPHRGGARARRDCLRGPLRHRGKRAWSISFFHVCL